MSFENLLDLQLVNMRWNNSFSGSKSLPPLHMVRPSKAPERSRPKKALANLDLGGAQNAVCGLLFKRTLGFQAPQEVFGRLGKILNKA